MRYRPLGRTGLTVSEIGFGAASWWGKPEFSERDAIRLVGTAVDGGVTFFDTGASYSGGHAEARLGRASLRKLGLEVLPLLQLHGPALGDLTDGLCAALADLKARGLVRALGVNSFDPAVIDHVLRLQDFDAVMIDYNVLRPEREPLIARAAAAGKAVLAGMPLAMGHTGGQVAKLRAPRDLWYAARGLLRHRGEVTAGARFGFLGRTPGMTGAQAALAYVLANPDVACAVAGTTRLAHLRDNLSASGRSLPAETLAGIRTAQAGLSR